MAGSCDFSMLKGVKMMAFFLAAASLNGKELGLQLEKLKVSVDPNTITTGIKTRDKHMREKIFKSKDKKIHPIEFSSNKISCTDTPRKAGFYCNAAGTLSIQGKKSYTEIPLSITPSGQNYLISGSKNIFLSAFKIPLPSYMGIRLKDKVTFNFKISAAKKFNKDVRKWLLEAKEGKMNFQASSNVIGMGVEGASHAVKGSVLVNLRGPTRTLSSLGK